MHEASMTAWVAGAKWVFGVLVLGGGGGAGRVLGCAGAPRYNERQASNSVMVNFKVAAFSPMSV